MNGVKMNTNVAHATTVHYSPVGLIISTLIQLLFLPQTLIVRTAPKPSTSPQTTPPTPPSLPPLRPVPIARRRCHSSTGRALGTARPMGTRRQATRGRRTEKATNQRARGRLRGGRARAAAGVCGWRCASSCGASWRASTSTEAS